MRFGAVSSLGWLPWVAEFVSAVVVLRFWGVRRPWGNSKGRDGERECPVGFLFSFQLFFVLFLFLGLLEKESKMEAGFCDWLSLKWMKGKRVWEGFAGSG